MSGKRPRKIRKETKNRERNQTSKFAANRRNQLHPYVEALIGRFRDPVELFRNLKREQPALIREVLRKASQAKGAVVRYAGIAFPKSYNHFLPNLPTPDAESLHEEIAWTFEVLSQFAKEINGFLHLKDEFEAALISGDIERATERFDCILQKYGFSLWTIESCILLAQLKGGLKENREVETSIRNATNDYFAQVICSWASQRAEPAVSVGAYDTEVESLLRHSREGDKVPLPLTYLRYKLNFFGTSQFTDDELKFIINIESSYGVVDRFLTIVRVMSVLVSDNQHQATIAPLRDSVLRAAETFDDSRLRAIAQLLNPIKPLQPTPLLSQVIRVADAYTLGQYEEAARLAEIGCIEHPGSFDFYELLCKALIHLRRPLSCPFEDSAPCAEVLRHVFTVLEKSARTRDSLAALQKTSYMWHLSRFGAQIFAFVAQHAGEAYSVHPDIFGAVNSSALSARFSRSFHSCENAITFLRQLVPCPV